LIVSYLDLVLFPKFRFYFFNCKGYKGVAKVAEIFLCACPACHVVLAYQGSEAYRGSLRKNLAFFAIKFYYSHFKKEEFLEESYVNLTCPAHKLCKNRYIKNNTITLCAGFAMKIL